MLRFIISLTILFTSLQTIASTSNAGSAWKIVANKEVCMVTNAHFTKPQIPVVQDGKTYYGCCQGCKATIQNDPASRFALDPLTKKQVDKATATIASNGTGEVLYFENKSNFDRYVEQQSKSNRK